MELPNKISTLKKKQKLFYTNDNTSLSELQKLLDEDWKILHILNRNASTGSSATRWGQIVAVLEKEVLEEENGN